MGQLGFQELLLIFAVALLVFGPKKLPELGKSLGKGLKEFKRATNDIKSSWEEQVRDVEKEVSDTTEELKISKKTSTRTRRPSFTPHTIAPNRMLPRRPLPKPRSLPKWPSSHQSRLRKKN